MRNFTDNFDLKDFFISDDFPDIAAESLRIARDSEKALLYLLGLDILEPVRALHKVPLKITSGFRSIKLNNALRRKYKTAKNSLHSRAIAVDFTTWYKKDRHLLPAMYAYIKTELAEQYGQVILYKYKSGEPRNIHVSLKAKGHKQLFAIKIV